MKPRFDDEQIVHHMLVRQLRPIIEPRLYRYAYGSLPGRGTHAAVKTMTRWRDEYDGKRFYVFEGDVKQFYDSIDSAFTVCPERRKRFFPLLENITINI